MDTTQIDARIAKLTKNRELISAAPVWPGITLDPDWDGKLLVEMGLSTAKSFKEDLKHIREYIRTFIPTWTDAICQIWSSEHRMYVSYRRSTELSVEFWMKFDVDDFPPELVGDTCRIEKTQRMQDDYSVVCDK